MKGFLDPEQPFGFDGLPHPHHVEFRFQRASGRDPWPKSVSKERLRRSWRRAWSDNRAATLSNNGGQLKLMSIALAVRIFVPFALGYFVASIFRSINAVIAPVLVRDLGLSASELGFASSAFFLSSIIMQLPYGVLLDRLDPRKLYASFLLLCALGAIVSAFANDVYMLFFGRALVAVGSSAGAVTSFKIYSMWYEPERLPLVNGMAIASGGLGLMVGTAPVEAALHFITWRDVHLIVAGFLLIAAMVILIIVPAKQAESSGITLLKQIKAFAVILKSLHFWRAAPLMMSVVGIYAGISTLWSGPWLQDVAGISGAAAANILLFLAAAFVLSGLLTGWLTSLVKRVGLNPMGFVASTAGLFTLVLVVLFLQWTHSATVVLITWILFGFIAPLNFVTYAALGSQFPKELGAD